MRIVRTVLLQRGKERRPTAMLPYHHSICATPTKQDNMRFVSWPVVSEGHYVLHPDPITTNNVGFAMASGALFARKFDLEVCMATLG